MLPITPHRKSDLHGIRELDPTFHAPPTPVPDPPPPPPNANVTNIILTAGGGVILFFDLPVIIDLGNPPATWTFGAAGLQPGGVNFNCASEVIPNNTVLVGDTAVIGDADPAARTPDGGYVNGTSMGVASG